jgi:hypothetical protein
MENKQRTFFFFFFLFKIYIYLRLKKSCLGFPLLHVKDLHVFGVLNLDDLIDFLRKPARIKQEGNVNPGILLEYVVPLIYLIFELLIMFEDGLVDSLSLIMEI